jgi:hypothetical protein
MSLARWPFRAVRIEVVGRAGVSLGLITIIGWCRVRGRAASTLNNQPAKLFFRNSRISHRWPLPEISGVNVGKGSNRRAPLQSRE